MRVEIGQSETRARNWPITISAAYLEDDQSGQSGETVQNYEDQQIFQEPNFYLCFSVVC